MGGQFSRREAGTLVAASLAGTGSMRADGAIPVRPLGTTGLRVSVLGLGSAPLGQPDVSQSEVDRLMGSLIDAGINYVDTAPIYGQAEERLGRALKGRRYKVVLVTKVETTSKQDALWQIEESLRKLQTDYLDAVHIHNVGRTDRFPSMEVLLGPDGALEGLKEARKKGAVRHIGMTCHLRPARALPVIATGVIELVMCAANFVDVHTYNFEGTVFEEARKRGLGIVAMKILGGTEGRGIEQRAKLSDKEHYSNAVRYALGIPGLSVAILGMRRPGDLTAALASVRSYQPLSAAELSALGVKGKEMAQAWGPLRGPVA